MKIIKTYMETNDQGEWKIQEQSNGIKVRLLKNPSESYKAKLKERQDKENERLKEEQEKAKKEKLISNRMRQIAERELQEEGLIE